MRRREMMSQSFTTKVNEPRTVFLSYQEEE
jgi:hypothetical protein